MPLLAILSTAVAATVVVILVLGLTGKLPANLVGQLTNGGSTTATSGQSTANPGTGIPVFPDLGKPKILQSSSTCVYFVDTTTIARNDRSAPGMSMRMRVYLPDGNHAPKSLGCVLVAPAGTNFLHGNDMENGDYHAETLPYVKAGMAVVFYSIDGDFEHRIYSSDAVEMRTLRQAYRKFKAARAGIINGRNALEFVLAKLPQVNPNRIYCAGHSSAGTLSLLVAANEPRIKGCIAFAPATDIKLRLASILNDKDSVDYFDDFQNFVIESSPTTYVNRFQCPVFLFHARDDSNEPFARTMAFSQLLQGHIGAKLTFSIADSGDHYQSMIDQGIPRAIEWLGKLPSERRSK